MSRTSSPGDLLDLLEAQTAAEKTVVLLPNGRAARELRAAFDLRRQSSGERAWEPAPVLSWAQWTAGLWNEAIVSGLETRLLLNAAQEHSLWTEIIAADTKVSALAPPDSLAPLARSAWALAAIYGITPRLGRESSTPDNRTFATWAEAFAKRCADRGYLSQAMLEDALREHLESRALDQAATRIAAPPILHLVGFGDLTPAQERLLAALQ